MNVRQLYCATHFTCVECKNLVFLSQMSFAFGRQEDLEVSQKLETHIRSAHPDRARALLDYKVSS